MKIEVPDGMLAAAHNEFFKAASLNGRPSVTDGERLLYALEAALLWLAEEKEGAERNLEWRRTPMKKIEVPEGMLAAAIRAIGPSTLVGTQTIALEAALLWLSENPINPSLEQLRTLLAHFGTVVNETTVQNLAVEWQRRMFLAPPEPNPVVAKVKQALLGSTLTAGDAVELVDAVRRCTSPEDESPTKNREAEVRGAGGTNEQTPEQKRAYAEWISGYKAPSGVQMGDS